MFDALLRFDKGGMDDVESAGKLELDFFTGALRFFTAEGAIGELHTHVFKDHLLPALADNLLGSRINVTTEVVWILGHLFITEFGDVDFLAHAINLSTRGSIDERTLVSHHAVTNSLKAERYFVGDGDIVLDDTRP